MYAVAGTLRNRGQYTEDGISPEQWRKMTKVFLARGYWFPVHDIAIAFTDKKFVFNENVKPIPLASRRMDYGSMECVASGYGRISKNKGSDVLLWAKLRLIPKSKCLRIHRRIQMNHFICTESHDTDVLGGDSGGPLVCRNTGDPNDKGEGVIVGVVSGSRQFLFGMIKYSFFTRVTSYQRFIRGNDATINLSVLNIVWISLIISHIC